MTTLLRLLALLVLIALQAALAQHLVVLGVPPDLPLVAVLVVGLLAGPLRGGLSGLAAGFALDVLRGSRLGLFALAAGIAGWLCGEAAIRIDPARGAVRWVVAAAAAVVYGLIVVAGSVLLGRTGVDVGGAMRHALVAAPYDATLATLAYWPLGRRSQGPTLPRPLPVPRRRPGRAT